MSDLTSLPRYICHKTVHAAKIVAIDFGERLDLAPHGVREVGASWIARHGACVGGYFVVYEDGYISFSPAQAFEGGYTRVDDEATNGPAATSLSPMPGLPADEQPLPLNDGTAVLPGASWPWPSSPDAVG